ncbi:MAG: cell division protein FtsZ [Opitutaceae bacterium]|nr:cell division protein FtsZ [Opitutaceae bacterium]
MNPNELPLENQIPSDREVAIKVVGVGGAGANTADRLKMENLADLQLVAVNTDRQALSSSPIQEKVLIGTGVTRGLGAGGDPDLGRKAAESDREKLQAVVKDCDLVFLLAGMGGGTGSGAAPILAELATEVDALVIAFVTMPFTFEGGRRLRQAEEGLAALRKVCDAVIPLPNDVLLQEAAENETVLDSFARADEWIGRAVKSIWEMLHRTGLINLDFSTMRQAFTQRGGKTLFGLGTGSGENAPADAIESLKMCPLLVTPEFSRKADRLLVNITGGPDLTLPKVNEMMSAVTDQFGRDSHVIMGAVIDENMSGRVEICVLGTSDVGGRIGMRRPVPAGSRKGDHAAPVPPAKDGERAAAPLSFFEGGSRHPAGAKPGSGSSGEQLTLGPAVHAPKAQQNEFSFTEVESRGYFDKTDRNLFEGQDLDVPTYLRKGIKIAL